MMSGGRVHTYILLVSILVAIVAIIGTAEAWSEPWGSVDTGNSRQMASAKYHCCCPNCPGRRGLRGCFPCRNRQYYCNCEQCSCFPEKPVDSMSFLQMLLRGGFSSRYRRHAEMSHNYEEK